MVKVVYASIKDNGVYKIPKFLIIVNNGISNKTVGNILFVKNKVIKNFRPLKSYLENAYDADTETSKDTIVAPDAAIKLLRMYPKKLKSANNLI